MTVAVIGTLSSSPSGIGQAAPLGSVIAMLITLFANVTLCVWIGVVHHD